MKQLFTIPKDLWGPRPWHVARMELQGFVKQNRGALDEHEVEFARWLYGHFEMAEHHTPPWSANSPAYVESVYNFINTQITDMEKHEAAIRKLYKEGTTEPEEIKESLVADGLRKLTAAYIRSVIRIINNEQRKAAA